MKMTYWIYVDSCERKCPYCGDITAYPEDECDKCGHKVLRNPREMGMGK